MVRRIKRVLRRVFTPITILVVPHSRKGPLRFKLPFAAVALVLLFACTGIIFTFSTAVNSYQYRMMKRRLAYVSGEISEMKPVILSLRKSEAEFRRIFSLKGRSEIVEAAEREPESGIGDVAELKRQISETSATVSSIKTFLARKRSLYRSTPIGMPVEGNITSSFGVREHPSNGEMAMHSGIDISVPTGTPVRATADGVITFADRYAGNGKVVVVEHGQGFNTVYAHNRDFLVSVGQEVRRGEVIARSGTSGVTTGPHVHYEVWKDGKRVNPARFTRGDYDVWKETDRN
jgi:murein DD-endopeptidase MepM/ murein hydrolase activator NlpD